MRFSRTASLSRNRGPVSMRSTARTRSTVLLMGVPLGPDGNAAVDRLLVDVRPAIECSLCIHLVQRMVRREAVKTAAAHVRQHVDHHFADGADFTSVTG